MTEAECTVVQNIITKSISSENVIVGVVVTVIFVFFGIALAFLLYLCCLTSKRTRVKKAVGIGVAVVDTKAQLLAVRSITPQPDVSAGILTSVNEVEGETSLLLTHQSTISYQTDATISFQSGLLVLCLSDALSQRQMSEVRDVVLLQDLAALSHLEFLWRHESQSAWLHLIRITLESLVIQGQLDEEKAQEILSDYDQALEDAEKSSEEKQMEAVQQLQQDGKSPADMERDLEKTYVEHLHRMDAAQQDAFETHVLSVLKESFSDAEVESLSGKLIGHIAKLEKDIGGRLELELNLLFEWLADRQIKAEHHIIFHETESVEIQRRLQEFNKRVNVLISDMRLGAEHKADLLAKYEEVLKKAIDGHQNKVFLEQEALRNVMRVEREKELKELEETQEAEAEDQLEQWCQSVSEGEMPIEVFIDAHHQLNTRHTSDWFALHKRMDVIEKEKMNNLRLELRQQFRAVLDGKDEEIFLVLREKARLSKRDLGDLLKIHKKNVSDIQDDLRQEFASKESEAATHIKTKHEDWQELRGQLNKERWQLIALQQKAVTQVLDMQTGLESAVRSRLLHEHNYYITRLAIQLQLSKLRQHKRLDQRLSQKKARLVLLQLKHEEEKHQRRNESSDIQALLAKSHQSEYRDAKLQVEQETNIASEELISHLAEQTSLALEVQDKRLGVLMGRMHVSQARKKSAIVHEEVVLRQLERQVLESVAIPEETSQEIYGQHQRDVDRIVRSRQESRDHQLRVMTEKLQSKQLRKKKKREGKVVVDGKSTIIMTKIIEDADDKQRIENQYQHQLTKQTAELDAKMEWQLKNDMHEIEKNFITHMAVEGRMTDNELESLVKKCYQDDVTVSVRAETLSRDLKRRSRDISSLGFHGSESYV